MFYVHGSSILKVLEGLKIDEILAVFWKGQKGRPGETLLEIFWIFGVPLGPGGAPFGLKKASFLGSDFLMIF